MFDFIFDLLDFDFYFQPVTVIAGIVQSGFNLYQFAYSCDSGCCYVVGGDPAYVPMLAHELKKMFA